MHLSIRTKIISIATQLHCTPDLNLRLLTMPRHHAQDCQESLTGSEVESDTGQTIDTGVVMGPKDCSKQSRGTLAFDRLGPSSFMLSQAACADDIPEEERMIPASLISFPLHTSLIFKADSMEITLFPTEEENEIGVHDRNEGKDVDAYAAGEEEADVEDDDDDDEDDDDDDDDDDEDDDDYDYDDDGDGNANGAAAADENNDDDESDDQEEAGEEAKVEVKVVEELEEEEEEQEDNEEECDSKAVEDPTDEDSSGSFLHSLSETSINEGLDESFCFQDDTDDSLDSASYNGEEDERLYSTERHAQSPDIHGCT
ncbi:uncharacterized protein AKAME5_001521500 [Lates japonicus]|uniref:Uncharacterized protein n=1 Tax=Lates japonicus TaxID=270547 RepID=A0AAD3N0W2_LATJO|nr:uncharacterized protein AKAME5_001521500 [Lates japonicus]